MQTVILCGGKGTRMREETEFRPKPLVEIGEKPMIWHIMKIYSHYGFNDFILCVGYKGYMIKQYFMEMFWRNNDFTLNLSKAASIRYHTQGDENWKITIVDTGQETLTGGRLKKVQKYIDGDTFLFTYGDGLSDLNLNRLFAFHNAKGKLATLTGVHPISPFGVMDVKNDEVTAFREKPVLEDMINGGFMVLDKKVFDYIPDADCSFEQEPLRSLAADNELCVYRHDGFWTAVDTFKDIERVGELWNSGKCPWKSWD